jgi:type II secretory pathway pseudopilin PulG
MGMHGGMRAGRAAGGFTYFLLLIWVALFGAGLVAVGQVWVTLSTREKEAELMFVGAQFRRAIQLYYERTPGTGPKQFPRKLEDLLLDPRYPQPQRYLRRIYLDPIRGEPGWGLVEAAGQGIMGVYSLSPRAPLKTGGFGAEFPEFVNARTYEDWKFVFKAPGVVPALVPIAPAESATGPSVAPPIPRGVEAPAQANYNPDRLAAGCENDRERDLAACARSGATGAAAAACYGSAETRFEACENAQSLPPLRLPSTATAR